MKASLRQAGTNNVLPHPTAMFRRHTAPQARVSHGSSAASRRSTPRLRRACLALAGLLFFPILPASGQGGAPANAGKEDPNRPQALASQGVARGVVIIAAKEGPTRFLDAKGAPLPPAKTAVGRSLTEGQAAQAGIGGKIVLLFSNGTVTTLQSQTLLKVREFIQEPFDPAGRKVSDLEGEPSRSNLKLDLNWGSMVVATKKLNKESTLNITSPTGTAGIRGTQFQLTDNPGAGVKLDVSESTVGFAPAGGGAPQAVGAGQGLDVSAAGVATPRPINPAAAQNITAVNTAAVAATDNVSLNSVSDAMTEATAEAAADEGGGSEGGDGEDGGGSEDGGDGGSEDGGSDAETDGGDGGGEDGGSGSETEGSGAETEGGETGGTESAETGGGEGIETGGGEAAANDSPAPAEPAPAPAPEVAVEVDNSQVLENNSDAKQARKTGKVSEESKALSKLGLTDEQVLAFHAYAPEVRKSLLAAGRTTARRLMNLPEVKEDQLATFFSYSPELQGRLLVVNDDSALRSLLANSYGEPRLTVLLTDDNLRALNAGQPASSLVSSTSDALRLELAAQLKTTGNSHLLDELLKLGNGELTPELARTGEVANQMLTRRSMAGSLPAGALVSGQEALANPFVLDVASVYRKLEAESFTSGEAAFLGGNRLDLLAGAYFTDQGLAAKADALVFAASQSLNVSGNVAFGLFNEVPPRPARVVLMSGEQANLSKGLSLKAATQDLVVAVRRDLNLETATLSASREITAYSLRNLTVRDSLMEASQLATLKAAKDLYADGLRFNQNLPRIVMEATTIRLRNVDFPAAAQVRLNSLKGPIDGRYPNFGTNVPAAQQIGRVNFLHNVKAGGNLLHDRPSFDLHGRNVTIGKLPGR